MSFVKKGLIVTWVREGGVKVLLHAFFTQAEINKVHKESVYCGFHYTFHNTFHNTFTDHIHSAFTHTHTHTQSQSTTSVHRFISVNQNEFSMTKWGVQTS